MALQNEKNSRYLLRDWKPENPAFWENKGKHIARRNLWISVSCLLLAFCVWMLFSAVTVNLNKIGFNFTTDQLFLLTALPSVSGALLRDLFSKDQLSKVMSTITLVFMLAPLVAPIIGGYIVKFFHWHAIFYVISLVGLLAAALVFFIIPETHKKENRIPLRLNIIARNFLLLWKQKEVLGYMFAASFGFGGLFAFVTAGSIVYIGIYGVPVDQFGYFFMMNIVTMIFASFLNSRFVTKVGAETMLRIALIIQFLSGMWLILTALLDLGFWPMAIGVAFFVGPNPVISSNAMASALERCPQMAGTANSLIGSVRFAVGAIMGSLVASMKMDTAAPMLFTMGACVAISVLAYYFLTSRNLKKSERK